MATAGFSAGDHRPGKYDATLGMPGKGEWGVSNATDGRQSLPDPDLHGDGTYDTSSNMRGNPQMSGDQGQDYPRDPDYPGALPPGTMARIDPSEGWSDQSIAPPPNKYPNFGDWPAHPTRFAGALGPNRRGVSD